jgi:ribosomal protein S18 acetylase RimI-like enzyme
MKRTPVAAGAVCGYYYAGETGGREPARAVAPSCGLLREATEHDATRIREFVCGLSPQSQYLRFFATVAPPSSGLLRVLCGGTGADILLVTDDGGTVIAHAMAADTAVSGGHASNIGLVVADSWQQQGLGTLLLSTLIGRASRRGVGSLVLDVLPSNDRMLGIIARRWPDAPRQRTCDAIIISPAITARQAASGSAVPAALSLTRDHKTRQSGDLRASNRAAA